MSEERRIYMISGILAILAITIWLTSFTLGRARLENDAIEHNAAYYEANPKTGGTTFKWKTQ